MQLADPSRLAGSDALTLLVDRRITGEIDWVMSELKDLLKGEALERLNKRQLQTQFIQEMENVLSREIGKPVQVQFFDSQQELDALMTTEEDKQFVIMVSDLKRLDFQIEGLSRKRDVLGVVVVESGVEVIGDDVVEVPLLASDLAGLLTGSISHSKSGSASFGVIEARRLRVHNKQFAEAIRLLKRQQILKSAA